MLQIMGHIDTSWICCVKVCTFDQIEQSKICILTFISFWMLTPTVRHNSMVRGCFSDDPEEALRQQLPDDLSIEQFPCYIYQTWDISCRSLQCIPASKQATSKQPAANCGTFVITCNLQLYAARYILSRMCKLTVIHFIVTCSLLYIPQDFPLFIIKFLTIYTSASHGSTNTSARCDWNRIKLNKGRFIACAPGWDTVATQTLGSLAWHCYCSHRKYDPRCTCEWCTNNRTSQ